MRTSWLTTICKFSFVLSIGLVGCDRGIKKNFAEPPNIKITSQTEIDYLTVYYYSLPSCVRCHMDTQKPDLSTYKSLKAEIDSVQELVSAGEMPPEEAGFEPLSACQEFVLDTWVSRGMPVKNGTNLGAPGNVCY